MAADAQSPWLDATEALVAEAWANALGGRRPGRQSSILDMRVGQLQAYRLLGEIERLSGIALPVTTILQAPTIPALADILRCGQPPHFTPAIAFRPGDDSPGLFLFPGLGGSVFLLFDLARQIEHAGTIYLNQPAGLDGAHAPHRTVAEMVRFQVDAIRAVQPSGPYLLLGHSLGANLAFEVARQLREAGEPVPFVGLVEAIAPERNWPVRVSLHFLWRRLAVHAGGLRGRTWRETGTRIAGGMNNLFSRAGRMFARRKGGWLPYRDAGLPSPVEALTKATLRAFDDYRITRFGGSVTLFQAETRDPLTCDPLLVWPRYLSTYTVRHVPGDHVSVLSGRNAAALGEAVSQALRHS